MNSLKAGLLSAVFAYLLVMLFMMMTYCAVGAEAKRQYRVVIIDSGFQKSASSRVKLCVDGHFDFIEEKAGIFPTSESHGTDVAESFTDSLDPKVNACVIVVRAVRLTKNRKSKYIEAWRYVDSLKNIDAVNASIFNHFGGFEFRNVVTRVTARVPVFTCAGNDSINLNEICNYFPACFRLPNLFVIGAGTPAKMPPVESYSNYGLPVSAYYPGIAPSGAQGTSFASPRAMADYLNSLGK